MKKNGTMFDSKNYAPSELELIHSVIVELLTIWYKIDVTQNNKMWPKFHEAIEKLESVLLMMNDKDKLIFD